MTNDNDGSGAGAASSEGGPASFPALILDGLQRHLGKLRQATTEFAAAPTEALTWTQSQALHDAIMLLLQVGFGVCALIGRVAASQEPPPPQKQHQHEHQQLQHHHQYQQHV